MAENAQTEKKKKEKKDPLLVPANKKGKHIMHFMNFLRVLFYPIHWILFPFRLHGAKKVGKGACIYVGNHLFLLDIFYPAHTTWEGIHFLSKQSNMDAPVLGWVAKKVRAIGAMRDGTDVRTVMDSMKILKNGQKLCIFPEGTRNRVNEEEFLPFHSGAALLSIKTKSPIVPFAICNRPRLFKMTHVVFGEPMEFTEFYGRKLTQEDYDKADEILRDRIYQLRAEFRAQRAKKKRKDKQ